MKVSDKVIQSLYQLIEQQGMKVGDRLASERKLCEQLGVSRSSLREALQQLNTQGIVQSRLGDGTYICQLPVTRSQHKIVQPLSGLIDPGSTLPLRCAGSTVGTGRGTARYAALRSTAEDRVKIHHFYDQISHFQSIGDPDQASVADAKFHLAIAEASHNWS